MIYEPHIECASAESLRVVQASRLKTFLAEVAAHLPGYREFIIEAGLDRDLQTASDEEILARFRSAGFTGSAAYVAIDAQALRTLDKRLFFMETTSGTTAAPKSRYATREDDLIDQRLLARSFAAFGITSSQRVLTVDLGELNMYALMTKALADLGVYDSLFYCARKDFSRSMKEALACRPDVLITVPSVLARSLSEFFDSLSAIPSLKKLIYYAEPLDEKIQQHLLKEFGIESFSMYSSIECGIIGAECEAHDGIHVWADCILPGLNDPSPAKKAAFKNFGDDTLEGALGLTTMMYTGKPTLAYLNGDEVQHTEASCVCGRTMPRISFVQRKTDVFSVFGTKFTYRQIHDVVYEHATVASFLQVILEDVANGTEMKLILPADEGHGVNERRDEIYNALRSHPSMSFIVSHGVLDFKLEFVAADFFTSRKIRKVEDRRSASAEPATIPPPT